MSSAHQVILAVIHRFFESNFKKSIVLSYDNQSSRNTGVSGVFSCPKTGFILIFSLIGSTGGNCTDKTLHAVGTFALHLVGHMAVYVQRKGRCGVAQITLHCLDVVPGADRSDCVGVTQIVETGIGTTRRFKSGCHLQKKTTLSGGFLLLPPRTAMRVL